MKKLNYLLLGAAGLLMASCANEELQAPGSNVEGNYKVRVKLPADMSTRAVDMNTGLTANDLYYAVYDAADNGLVLQNKTFFTESAGGALETEVGFNLAPGKSYYISFFAAAPGAATNDPAQSDNYVYTFDAEEANMSVNYGKMTSAGTEENDTYDCFINLLETKEIGSTEMQTSIVLYRPIAQINWGTSDLDEPAIAKAYGVDGKYILSNLTTSAYNTWSLLDNDVDTDVPMVDVNYPEPFIQPQDANGLAAFPVNPSVYGYVAMQYLLAPRQSETIYDLNLNISNEGEGNPDPTTLSADVEVSSAPVQANYQTNIYGSLLTDNVVVNVEKSPAWFTPSYDVVEDDQSLLSGLQAGNNVMLNKDITFSKYVRIDKPVSLDLNGHNIIWDEAEDGAFYVVEGGNLTITGQGTITASKDEYATLVWVNGGEATIHNGTFVGSGEGQLIYCQKGTITIYGGTYNLIGTELNKEYFYPINCRDQEYDDGLAHIIVKGGVYYNFNPANNPAEGANTSFVAEGYQSTELTMADGEKAWAVTPNGTTPVVNNNQSALTSGGNIMLAEDVTYTGTNGVVLGKNTEIDLNNNTLNATGGTYGDNVIVQSGAQVTISNGVINASSKASGNAGSSAVILQSASGGNLVLDNVTINGGPAYAVNLISASPTASIVINSGTYYSEDAHGCAIFCGSSTVKGSITINGGTFGRPGYDAPYLLNLLDSLREKPANEYIIVKGGTFINFNPADCISEGQHTNFVADGYTVTSRTVGNDIYYTVVKAN